jgi:hypothetical protein
MAIQTAGNFYGVALLTDHVMASYPTRTHQKGLGASAVDTAELFLALLL